MYGLNAIANGGKEGNRVHYNLVQKLLSLVMVLKETSALAIISLVTLLQTSCSNKIKRYWVLCVDILGKFH